jgi:hypothetical protein
MRRSLALPLFVLLLAAVAAACGAAKEKSASNVRPPRPGVPAAASDVTGIYRSIHQGVLQLRAGGDFVLVVPDGPGPSAGTYTLRDGRMEVRTGSCGVATGGYDVVVSGKQEAGKAVLNLTAVADACEPRRHYLTVDPWVYANS